MYATLICAATVLIPFAYGQLNGDVRLYGSDQLLQVYYEGKWGFVCDDLNGDTLNVAKVVCRQLGITPPTGYPKMFQGRTTDSGDFLLDDVKCNGNETGISDCYRFNNPWGSDDCGTHEGVSVHCSQTRYCASNPHGCREICVYGRRGYNCSSCPKGNTNTTAVPDRSRCTDINDHCSLRTHNCSHYCQNRKGGYHCRCPSGLIVDTDLRTCVAPCARLSHTDHACSHSCSNVGNSYKCSCPSGFQLDSDGLTCLDLGLNIECTSDELRVTMPKNQRLDGAEAKNLVLNDPNCRAKYNQKGNAFMFVSKLDDCGMIKKELPSAIEYHNTIRTDYQGIITFLPDVIIPVKCVMERQYTVAKNLTLSGKPDRYDTKEVFDNGNYEISMKFYATENSLSLLQPPITMRVGERLFLEVAAKTSDGNLTLFLNKCYATPSNDTQGPLRYVFLENGCSKVPMFETYNTTDSLIKRFSVKGFKFNAVDTSEIYFGCDVTMCDIADMFSRCRKGCITSGHIAKRHQLELKDGSSTVVRAGPVHIF